MSRAYRIRVKESLKRDLSARDEIDSVLEILEILPKEQMAELLKGELKGRGFSETEDGKLSRVQDGIRVSVDPNESTVSISAESTEEISLEATREGWGYDDVGPNSASIRKRLEEEAKRDLERRAEQQRGRLQTEATQKLEAELADLQDELGQVVNRVTAEALKAKARQLGEIKEISEDPEAGALTIKVEV